MSEVIEYIKNQPSTKQEVATAIAKYKSASLATQAAAGEKMIAQVTVYDEAIQIMGDSIYDLNVENDSLRTMIGHVDEKEVQDLCQKRKMNDSRNDKNKIILASLKKTISKNKAICNNSPAATVTVSNK
jgi:hypothetical protein